MTRARFFKWVQTETESADLQRDGARVCEASLGTHHAFYAVLHELTPAQFHSLQTREGG